MSVEAVDLTDGGALVRAKGVDSEAAGKVVRCERVEDGPYLYYRARFHGREWNVLVRKAAAGGSPAWTAYLPGASQSGFPLTYEGDASARVDSSALYAAHSEQTDRGELEALSRFDRPSEEASEQAELDKRAERTAKECQAQISALVEWATVSDQQLMEKSVSGYCDSILSGLRNVCRFAAGRAFVKSHVTRAVCRFDGEAELALAGKQLRWSISFDTVNLSEKSREALLATQAPGSAWALGEEIEIEKTAACANEKGEHVVLVGPRDGRFGGLAYGDGSRFFRIATPSMLGDGWFFDPRQRNEKHNQSFRGHDLRVYSYVEPDVDKGSCKLVCGTRTTELTLLDPKAKAELLQKATFEKSPHGRRPYALARDKQAIYYYVDTGDTPQTQKDFQLYRGKRGRLKPLSMRDVVSDSEGEVFESEGGKLRLLLGHDQAEWVSKGKSRRLLRLPVQDNYGLIYNELGVYLGERLGVPCDDF